MAVYSRLLGSPSANSVSSSAERLSSDPPRVAYTATAVASLVHEVRRTRSHEATPADPCRHARPSARAASAASSHLEQHRACAAASRLPSGVARAAARSSRWSGPGTGGTHQVTRVARSSRGDEHSGTTACRGRPPTAGVVSWDRTTRPYHVQLESVHEGLLRPLLGRRASTAPRHKSCVQKSTCGRGTQGGPVVVADEYDRAPRNVLGGAPP